MLDLIKSIQNRPTDPIVHWELGEVYEENGNLISAIAQYRTSITLGNGTPYSFLTLASVYFCIGQIKHGIEICRQLVDGGLTKK
ncbi:hypothetical protein ABEX47_23300 [Paenibacillus ehimensis]|uniref:tetratricopeptide repeat protein n=1 Tax=Paenibacillus ehimensis TaxID=79264 RepID=UPI003D2D4F6E